MDKNKLTRILDGLFEQTEKNALDWKETANPGTFLTLLQGSVVSVTHINLFNLAESITFEFRDENGEIFESQVIRKTDSNVWNKAVKVYNLARNKALKMDEKNAKIDNILKQLESGKQ